MNGTGEWYIKLINLKQKDGYKFMYKNYFPSLCRFSSRLTNLPNESEDLVQDLFLRLWKSKITFPTEKALASYLYLAVKNASLNLLRDRARKQSVETINLKQLKELESDSVGIQQLMIEEEVSRIVYTAINKLTPERKNVILLSLKGLSNQEIAQQIGISINTVKSLKLRTYESLRRDLKPAFCMFFL